MSDDMEKRAREWWLRDAPYVKDIRPWAEEIESLTALLRTVRREALKEASGVGIAAAKIAASTYGTSGAIGAGCVLSALQALQQGEASDAAE